jgi:hypothetical protein
LRSKRRAPYFALKGRQRIAQYQIFQAIEAQRKLVDDARTKTREVRRSMARRPPAGAVPASESSPAGEGSINWDKDPATFPVETWENVR